MKAMGWISSLQASSKQRSVVQMMFQMLFIAHAAFRFFHALTSSMPTSSPSAGSFNGAFGSDEPSIPSSSTASGTTTSWCKKTQPFNSPKGRLTRSMILSPQSLTLSWVDVGASLGFSANRTCFGTVLLWCLKPPMFWALPILKFLSTVRCIVLGGVREINENGAPGRQISTRSKWGEL